MDPPTVATSTVIDDVNVTNDQTEPPEAVPPVLSVPVVAVDPETNISSEDTTVIISSSTETATNTETVAVSSTTEDDTATTTEGTKKSLVSTIGTMVTSTVSYLMFWKKKEDTTKVKQSLDCESTDKDKNDKHDDETKKNKGSSSTAAATSTTTEGHGLPSVGSILQILFYILVIGQTVPGPHSDYWPFKDMDPNKKKSSANDGITPRYVELRSDMYGHERQFAEDTAGDSSSSGTSSFLLRLLLGQDDNEKLNKLPLNTGIPKEQNIILTLLNREYETYQYSMVSSTQSKVIASKEYGIVSFQRAIEKSLYRITTTNDKMYLAILEDTFLQQSTKLITKINTIRTLISTTTPTTFTTEQCNSTNTTFPFYTNDNTIISIDEELQCDLESISSTIIQEILNTTTTKSNTTSVISKLNSITTTNTTTRNQTNVTTIKTDFTVDDIPEALRILNATYIEVCTSVNLFLKNIQNSFPPGISNQIKDAIVGHSNVFGCEAVVTDLQQSPMRIHFTSRKKRLFVITFIGDIMASEVSNLRKEVTAIVRNADSTNDEVLIILQSGGGTVTGYGLVAGQLLRIKNANIKLTIAVEQVAASGGYMAACIADIIICSPFAVVGSIGVIQEIPNVHERLKREGVEFHQITAGDWKRVLSPTKQVTDEDLQKAKSDVEDVWTLFKDFVYEQRPTLNMTLVATGEVWFGQRAVDVGLCDTIQPSDDIITNYIDRGYDVYTVAYKEPIVQDAFEKFFNPTKESSSSIVGLFIRYFLQQGIKYLSQSDNKVDHHTTKYSENTETWKTMLLT